MAIGEATITPRATAVARIRDVLLGGQDGLVNVLGLVLGLAVATGDTRVIITAALASMFAESIAMAGVAFTSRGAERAYADDARGELQALLIQHSTERIERRRAALIHAGRDVDLVDATVEAMIDEAAGWQASLELLERSLAPIRQAQPARAAAIVGLSTFVGSAIPLVPFLVLPVAEASIAALLLAGIVLFIAGVERGRITGGARLRSGIELVAIGLASALAGFLIGRALRAPGA